MPYPENTLGELATEYDRVTSGLSKLVETLLIEFSPKLTNKRASEYLKHGVCRRLRVIERCIEQVFGIFPPDRVKLLERDELSDVQINLHAFVINLFGILDNLAWVYVLELNLESEIGDRRGVGLFTESTQKRLPVPIQEHLTLESTRTWYDDYVKNYRDALAHRIPLYVPPSMLVGEDGKRAEELNSAIEECFKNGELEKAIKLTNELNSLALVCNMFSHSFSETESRQILLHPQLLSDGATILELGSLYVEHFPITPQ